MLAGHLLGAEWIFSARAQCPKAHIDGEVTITVAFTEPRTTATSTLCATSFVARFFVAADTTFVKLSAIGDVDALAESLKGGLQRFTITNDDLWHVMRLCG